MLDRLVNYADLSPLYPGNETLTKASDDMFRKVMDKWTEAAKSEPYVTRAVWDTIPPRKHHEMDDDSSSMDDDDDDMHSPRVD